MANGNMIQHCGGWRKIRAITLLLFNIKILYNGAQNNKRGFSKMPKYKDIILFSFGCAQDFESAVRLQEKYLQKGYVAAQFYHVVLTLNPNAVTPLKQNYPHLANEILDIDSLGDGNPLSKLQRSIDENTKVVITGHGTAPSDHISSQSGETITMPQLAKLLKENCPNKKIAITLLSCKSGRGTEVNSVDGSIAETLRTSLEEYEIEATISAPTTNMSISLTGKKELPAVITDPDLLYIRSYENTISKQLGSLSIFPWPWLFTREWLLQSWISIGNNLQELYDIETGLLMRTFHKGLGSKVILHSRWTHFFSLWKI